MWRRFPAGLRGWFGIELHPVSHAERIVSGVGGFLGIYFILLISQAVLGEREPALLIVGSMGASAVLLFGVPHGPLSQPWSLIGGHTVSALIGVTCAHPVSNPFVATALAVGLAIGVMHYLRCIHPPGGATAIVSVLGGPAIHDLGYQFLFTPVLLNVVIILATAVAVNGFFAWRRYPAALGRKTKPVAARKPLPAGTPSHSDIQYALHEINSVLDISEEDLARIFQLAAEHAKHARLESWQIKLHGYYSNGRYGEEWAVRQVVDVSPASEAERDRITFRVMEGKGRGES
ncbi:MAG: HPP family protein, partial [Gammaproteobacteria bacterium]|nr:HPP family protein [Gammaproteobacteria bacterium]